MTAYAKPQLARLREEGGKIKAIDLRFRRGSVVALRKGVEGKTFGKGRGKS